MKRIILAAALTIGLASPAFASHCPKDMTEIDAALAKDPQSASLRIRSASSRRADLALKARFRRLLIRS